MAAADTATKQPLDPEPDDVSGDECEVSHVGTRLPQAGAGTDVRVQAGVVRKPNKWLEVNVLVGGKLELSEDGFLVAARDLQADASLVLRVEPCETAPVAKSVLWGAAVFRRAAYRAVALGTEERRAAYAHLFEIIDGRKECLLRDRVDEYTLPSKTVVDAGVWECSSEKQKRLNTTEGYVHNLHVSPASEDKATIVVVDPIALLAGQSCLPNTIVEIETIVSPGNDTSQDLIVQVNTLTRINKGERITLNHSMRQHLMMSHGMKCRCCVHTVCQPLSRTVEAWHRVEWCWNKAKNDVKYAIGAYFNQAHRDMTRGSVDRLGRVGVCGQWPDFPSLESCVDLFADSTLSSRVFDVLDACGKDKESRDRRKALVKWATFTLTPPTGGDFIFGLADTLSAYEVASRTKGDTPTKEADPEMHIPPPPLRAPHLALLQEHMDTHDAMAGHIALRRRKGFAETTTFDVVHAATSRFIEVGTNFTALVCAKVDASGRSDRVTTLALRSDKAETDTTRIRTLFEGLKGCSAPVPVGDVQSDRLGIAVIDATRAVLDGTVDLKTGKLEAPGEVESKGGETTKEARIAELVEAIIRQTPFWCDAIGHVLHDAGKFHGDKPGDKTPFVGVTPLHYLKLCIQGMQPYNPTDAKRYFSFGSDALVPPGVVCVALSPKVNAALRELGVPFEQRTMHVVVNTPETRKRVEAARDAATASGSDSIPSVDVVYFGLGFLGVKSYTAAQWVSGYIMVALREFSAEAEALCSEVPSGDGVRVVDPYDVDH